MARQSRLSTAQTEAFYHDAFVSDQLADFVSLCGHNLSPAMIVDVGGGCGYFSSAVTSRLDIAVRVIDIDPVSIETCKAAGLDAELGDALAPRIRGDEQIACFNLMLHHLVGRNEVETRQLQMGALRSWRRSGIRLFVNEYIYESYFASVSGWLIFQITKSRLLSAMGRLVARIMPAFRANTFGVGVRFRSSSEWTQLFNDAGFQVIAQRRGVAENIALPLRILLIREIRRASFLLEQSADFAGVDQ
jgi:hypothetical protein